MGTFDTAYTEANVRPGICQLEEALAAQKAALAGQKERLSLLKEAAEQEQARCADLEEEAVRLGRENDEAGKMLEAVYREGSDLQAALARDLADARRQALEQGRQLDHAIEQADLDIENCSRLQQEAGALVERLGLERDARQQRADQINEEHQAVLARLNDDLRQAEERSGENINHALSQWENARIEHEAADSRLHLAQTSLEDIDARLAETLEQLTDRENALRSLEEERQAGLVELGHKHDEALAEIAARRAEKEKQLQDQQNDIRRVRALSELSATALNEASSRIDQLSQNLHELYTRAEAETSSASQKMSDAIKQVLGQRENHKSILAEANRLEEELSSAQSAEADLKDRLLLLQTENQDLSSAALVANDLAVEAQAACREAGPELLPALKEMEEALLASAREAQAQAKAKAAELQETEETMQRAALDLTRLQESRQEVKQRLREAESSCLTAEDSMLDLSGQVGRLVSGRSENFDKIKSAREEYESANKELRTLKETANSAAGDLRQAQLEESRLRQALLQLEQKAAQIDSDHQKGLNQLAANFKIRVAEAASMLAISQDKQSRLLLNQTQKQAELEQATSLLAQSGQREQELKEQLDACRARENAITEELRAQIARQKEDGNQNLGLANREAEEAAARLNEASQRVNAISAAMDRAKAKIAALKETRAGLGSDLSRREDELLTAFDRRKQEVDERCRDLSRQLADTGGKLDLARHNAVFARQRAAADRAGADAAASAIAALDQSIDSDTDRLIELRKVEARLQAEAEAEAKIRQAREEEARLLREAEAKAAAEENARRLAELEEAAHAAALAEQARLAKEKAERAALFEEETVQMAAGRRLERQQLLQLLENDGLNDRVQRINELAETAARNSDFRYIKDSEIAELRANADIYDQQAREEAQSFNSCRAVLTTLKEKQSRLENERRQIAPQLAAAMSQMEKVGHEYDAIRSAKAKLEATAAADDEVSQALSEAGSGLERALEANRRQAAVFESELGSLQQRTSDLEQQLADTRRQYEEAADVIEDVTAKWLYKESAAATARANLAEIDRTAESREEFRRQREAAAAARAQAKPAPKNNRSLIWRRRKRG